MAQNQTVETKASVTEYVAGLTDERQRADAKSLIKVMQAVMGVRARMWGPAIIGFGSYHYKYESGREGDSPVIAFSPRKAALVLYNVTGFEGSEAMLEKLGKHSRGKGCLYIKKLSDVDGEVLRRMIQKGAASVRARYGV